MIVRILVLVFFAYFTVSIVDSERPSLNELIVKCGEENGLETEEAEKINSTRYLETNDEKTKCYVKCVLTGLELMNEEGDLTLDDDSNRKLKFKKHFPACKNVTGTDPCDKAVNFQNCVRKQIDMQEKTPE